MAMPTAAEAAAKWKRNMDNAGPSIAAGVNRVTVSPGVAAAANQAGYLAGVQQNVQKWAARVAAVPLQTWKDGIIKTGIARMQQGTTNGVTKMQSFLTSFLPHVANVQAQVKAMPNVTDQDKINRMVANMMGLKAYQKPT